MNIVFDKEWFKRHQVKLIWCLNAPLIKYWFRYCLRIHSFDCPFGVKINAITPNSFFFGAVRKGKKIEVKADFRTHDKYSKRLYFAFKPFWYLLHFADWAMLDRVGWLTQFNFGFSTLTVYPDAGSGATTTDGALGRSSVSEDWSTIRGGAGVDVFDTNTSFAGLFINADTVLNKWANIRRSIFTFDTSPLTAGATISAGVLSLYGDGADDSFAVSITPDADIYTATPASSSTLAASDYSQIGTTSQTGAPISYASYSATFTYIDFTFSATGRGNISKTAISKFGLRNANYDVANSSPLWSSGGLYRWFFFFADNAGTTKDPKLVVTYSTGGGAAAPNKPNLALLGVG